jgi:hypothetical protein
MIDFKSILKEQKEELESISAREKIILRENLEEAKEHLVHPNVLVITGIRRCGKSIFAYLIVKEEEFIYINFDDERLANINPGDLNEILCAGYELFGNTEYIILDEIQNIKGWELFVNRLRRTKKVIITGSNSNLLSSELATHLTGRHTDIRLFPFSFKEYLKYKGFQLSRAYTTLEKSQIINLLEEYIKIGGMPEAYKLGNTMLLNIYEDILTKDIILRYRLTKFTELKNLSRYIISNSGTEISYNKLTKTLGIGHVSTISNWIAYMESAFLYFKTERFDYKLKKQYLSNKKFYCIDTGLINNIGFKFSEEKGRLMENLVAIELQRRKNVQQTEVYYWKDNYHKEVDFILKKDRKIIEQIQVTYTNTKTDIKERETEAMKKAGKELKTNKNIIITWNYESEEKGIKYIPLWKWLLE